MAHHLILNKNEMLEILKTYSIFKINKLLFLFSISFCSISISQNNNIAIEGKVVDEFNYGIPYTAITIVSKNLGTSSNEEGSFNFLVSKNETQDTLEFSSIGFKTLKISIVDFIKLEDKEIVLQENVTMLSDVVITSSKDYVKRAVKNLRKTTITDPHQLNILYRRWSVEDSICRFYIEQYINAVDRGPSSYISKFTVKHSRTSADYTYIKRQQKLHALMYMEQQNPLRRGINVGAYKWKKTGASSYDGEDIVIIEGIRNDSETLRLYIGFDTYGIYKVERYNILEAGKSIKGSYIYKKHKDGRLYLSYHNREWKDQEKYSDRIKSLISSTGKTPPNSIPVGYRHEVFVLGFEEDKKLFDKSGLTGQMDMTLFKIPYDSNFWKNISLPPETAFYKKNIADLESIYDVPIDTQFKYSN